MSQIPDDIASLLSTPVEYYININVVILEGEEFTDEALTFVKEKGGRSVVVSHLGGRGYCR